jgi:putative FmdB family regulatory protein
LPTYEYRCVSCDHQFERFQRMSDEPVKECEACGQPVKRLLFPVAIQFKGNGFYTTDYGRRGKVGSPGGSSTQSANSESSSDGGAAKDAPKVAESSSKDSAKASTATKDN